MSSWLGKPVEKRGQYLFNQKDDSTNVLLQFKKWLSTRITVLAVEADSSTIEQINDFKITHAARTPVYVLYTV